MCDGKTTGYQSNECIREGFAYQTIRSVEAKVKPYDHSLWEHVNEGRPQICGTYIPLGAFVEHTQSSSNGLKPVTVNFSINLPITDILPLQAFTLYPNFCLGNLELKFYVKPYGMVWAPVNVLNQYEKELALGIRPAGLNYDNWRMLQTINSYNKHGFTQIGNSAYCPTSWYWSPQILRMTAGPCTLTCKQMRITRCKSTILGFNVKQSSLDKIRNFFITPRYIPSQELKFYSFPHPPTENGLQSSINVPLHNCNCISFMFPQRVIIWFYLCFH
jgi:hypothetical protein